MKAVWKTELGNVRNNNEDALLVDEDHGIFLLADGMGGHNAGEVASDIAVKEAYAFMLKEAGLAVDEGAVLSVMEEAIRRAHYAIKARAESFAEFQGMGTTLVELYVRDGRAYLCHAGDSRAYLFRDTLRRITRDHTAGNSDVEQGSPESEKVRQRMRHALTQAVGPRVCPVPDTKSIESISGDIFLLCSDGLTDMLNDEEIQDIFMGHKNNGDDLVDVLIRDANEKGGRDNISVIMVQI